MTSSGSVSSDTTSASTSGRRSGSRPRPAYTTREVASGNATTIVVAKWMTNCPNSVRTSAHSPPSVAYSIVTTPVTQDPPPHQYAGESVQQLEGSTEQN